MDALGRRNFAASKANTHVIRHAGRILALVETSFPYEIPDELETVGLCDLDGRLTTAMTAHPKVCSTNGELHFFGYGHMPPYLTYHVVDAAGALVTSRAVDVPGPTMMHDFNLTQHFVVFMDLPIVFDLGLALAGDHLPYRFDVSYGARLGVLRRDDPHAEVRWFEIEPCYVFRALNAHDDGVGHHHRCGPARVALQGARREPRRRAVAIDDRPGRLDPHGTTARRPAHGATTRVMGGSRRCRTRPIWRAAAPSRCTTYVGGSSTTHEFQGGRVPGEAVFAPADDRPRGPGWLLTHVYDPMRDASDVVVIDPDHPEDEPVAAIHLPTRVPCGFHGSWLPAD